MHLFTVPTAFEVPADATLTDTVYENARTHPDQIVLHRSVHDAASQVNAAQFAAEVTAVAKGLLARGVQPDDRVAIMSRTRYEWVLLDHAIWAIGAVTVPIYETSAPAQIAHILHDSGAIGCVVETDAHAALVKQVEAQTPDLQWVEQFEVTDSKAIAGLDGFVAAGHSIAETAVTARRRARQADDLATIIYTSGTTGAVKGCRLTHRNFLFGVGNGMAVAGEHFNDSAKFLLFLPLAHVLAREVACGAIRTRTQMAFSPDTTTVLNDLGAFSPTVILAVPRVFEKVYNSARQKAYASGKGKIFDKAEQIAVNYSISLDKGSPSWTLRIKHAFFDALVYRKLRAAIGGQCRSSISGGAPLGKRLGHFFRGVGLTIYEGYGLTETTAACAVNTPEALKIGTVGRPLPGVSMQIAEDGEVLVKSQLVCDGYWNNEQATTESFDAEGWFHTGDLGSLDDEGYLTITGRKKEIIVTAAGKNVAPAALEDRLRAHALISQCMVVGDDRPFIGCLITIDSEMFEAWKKQHNKPAGATVADLRNDEHLRAEIQQAVDTANSAVSRAESIKVFRILTDDFTIENGALTPSLKVKRHVVSADYADEIATIYA